MLTWTNNPYESSWEQLLFLSYSSNVLRLLDGTLKSNRTLLYQNEPALKRKAVQISAAIKQGYEYFTAADNVTINTSPLLYFYGMLSLSKALLVANVEELFLDDIKYHGLHTRPITEELKNYSENKEIWTIEKEYAVTNDGVFNELNKLIHGISIPKDNIIQYKTLLALDPELSIYYEKYYNESPTLFNLYSFNESNNPYKITLSPAIKNKMVFEKVFPNITADFDLRPDLLHGLYINYVSKSHLSEFPKYFRKYRLTIGGEYLLGGIKINDMGKEEIISLNLEIMDYLNMFILSTLVRYKQEFWNYLITGERDGSIGLLNLSVSAIRKRFPNFILDNLFNEKFEYGSVGRIG